MRYYITTDAATCIACKACEVHCKVWNNVPIGLKLGTHVQQGPSMQGGKPHMHCQYMTCQHCEDAPCCKACPTGAMQCRADGIVYVDTAQCVGCKLCRKACPWAIPQYDKAARKMRKCDLCRHRLDAGLLPACVTACTTKSLALVRV